VFGTIATLLGALGTRYIGLFQKNALTAGIPTVISNTVIIPLVIVFTYSDGQLAALPFTALTVMIGEIISCSVLGGVLLIALKKYKKLLFGNDNGYANDNRKDT
jgi:hypothetical protein